MADNIENPTEVATNQSAITVLDVEPVPAAGGDSAGAPGTTADQYVKSEVKAMDELSDKVNPGYRMGADVEAQYKGLLAKYEGEPQSAEDRELAVAARTRMLDHYHSGGDNTKFAQMAIETAQKYPEVLTHRMFQSMAAAALLDKNPQFRELMASQAPEQRGRFESFVKLRPHEESRVAEAVKQMDNIDNDPATAEDGYRDVIAGAEVRGQTRADRIVASAARMRLTETMFDGGRDRVETLNFMQESVNRYPELAQYRRFVAIANGLGASQYPGWVDSFSRAGGDISRLERN